MDTSSMSCMGHSGTQEGPATGTGIKDSKLMISECLEKCPGYGSRAYQCKLCGKINSDKSSASKHVEAIHFPGMFTYTCKYCGKTFNARNNMYVHISQHHKKSSL